MIYDDEPGGSGVVPGNMMQITIRLFATLRQEAGWSQREMVMPEGATLDDLLVALAAEEKGLTLTDRSAYAAVNREYARRNHVLHDGDVVALFPPVSGGRSPDAEEGR